MEQMITITMSVAEFKHFLREEIGGALDEKIEPIKRRFEEKYLSVKEVAQVLGVTTRTIHSRVYSGKLTAYGKGKNMRFKESEITQYLEGKHGKPY